MTDYLIHMVWEKKMAYVKDGRFNFNNMIVTLKSIVNCEALGFEENYQGTCFGNAFLKTS